MTSPSIIHAYDGAMVGPLLFAFLTTAFFWRNVVPRQLRGLRGVPDRPSNVRSASGDVHHGGRAQIVGTAWHAFGRGFYLWP